MSMTAKELEESFKGPGFVLAFLYYFGVSAFMVAIAAMKIMHLEPQSAIPYQYGIALALPFGLFNALSKRSKTLTIHFKKATKFQQQLNAILLELQFERKDEPEIEDGITYQTYRRAGIAGALAGTVYVAMTASFAVIASRATIIKKLNGQLNSQDAESSM